MHSFLPAALPVLIGSLPLCDHQKATRLIFVYTPQIPLWPQLPANKAEGMLLQFLPGMPGVSERGEKIFIDTGSDDFDAQLLSFYEDYMTITEGGAELEHSRFTMSAREAGGFFTFLEQAESQKHDLVALKGQLTGPITFCTGLVDEAGKALFYNEQLRDVAVKLLALKARWQTAMMARIKPGPLVFFDEPGLAGFGSSAFITITPEDITTCLTEVFEAVRSEGGLAGVHVCANTEWSVIFESGVDVVSYDAYSYFDKLELYPKHLASFLTRGGILASGIVPTSIEIETETADSLAQKYFEQTARIASLGLSEQMIFEQSLITPSCGTGTVPEDRAQRVLELTRDVSAIVRSRFLQQ